MEGPRHRCADSVQAGQGDPHENHQDRFSVPTTRSRGTAGGGIEPYLPKSHLNMWVAPLQGGLLGYAQFPGGPHATDGVVITYRGVRHERNCRSPVQQRAHGHTRSRPLPEPPSHLGRHARLQRLRPVPDTPNCAGPNFGMPTWPIITCNNGPNGDMFVNYMDYTDDAGDGHVHCATSSPNADRTGNRAQRLDVGRCRASRGTENARPTIRCLPRRGCASSRRIRPDEQFPS